MQQRTRCDQTAAWSALRVARAGQYQDFDLRQAFAADPGRFDGLSQQAPHVFADLSKNLLDAHLETLLLQLAGECGVSACRDAMFAGEPINNTERRAVRHVLLRTPRPADGSAMVPELAEVHATLDAMLDYAERLRQDSAITDVVNIGIGGSDLGPQMAVRALDAFALAGKRLHFVSNVDGQELAATLKALAPASTMFLIASKTFTTIETMTNAASAKRWFEAQGGSNIARHFCALTTNVEAANRFGITTTFGVIRKNR